MTVDVPTLASNQRRRLRCYGSLYTPVSMETHPALISLTHGELKIIHFIASGYILIEYLNLVELTTIRLVAQKITQ